LVGNGTVGPGAGQGWSVAISADGNTAVVGGSTDTSNAGATWVYTRSGGVWSQQGGKLVGTGAVGGAAQGASVAVSADGKTTIVGGRATTPMPAPRGSSRCPPTSPGCRWRATTPARTTASGAATSACSTQARWQANAQITFFGSDALLSNTTYVPAGTQSILTDVVGQLGASGSGAIEVLSDQPLKVTARTYNEVSSTASCYPDGTQGQDYPAVATGGGLSAGQSAYLAGLTENASYRCNIGVVNTGTASATVLVELFDGAGTKLADYTVSLAAGQWAQETQPFKSKAGCRRRWTVGTPRSRCRRDRGCSPLPR
jgi:hypothetical protein